MEWNGQMMPELNNSVRCPSVRPSVFFFLLFICILLIIILQPKISFAAYIYITYIAAHKNSVSRSFARISLEQRWLSRTQHITSRPNCYRVLVLVGSGNISWDTASTLRTPQLAWTKRCVTILLSWILVGSMIAK